MTTVRESADLERRLFDGALLQPRGPVRDAWLEGACGDDAALRHNVVELIRLHEEDSGFLNEEQPTIVPAPSEQAGEMIGPYKLLQQIGEGGFGTVWMAEQVRPVTRRVALKIIKAGMDTHEVIARFEAERQALAMMDHPNIAQVFDAGATDKGRPYFVMELVRGIPVTRFCDEQRCGMRERLALFGDVCSAINHAHQKGIIHRDIKPSNVMVTLHGDKPVVKVIDFGIAKATQGRLTDKTLFTRFEQFIGTPAYMSPEQAALSGLDIDTRSDIYSLGVLLYELLTGKPPFDARTLASAGYEEMRRIIRETEPARPSARLRTTAGEERTTLAKARRVDPDKLDRVVEADLDWIVMKAIEKDRARRYETANALALDVRRFLTDEPVSATPPGSWYKFRKFARRHKVAFRAGAAIAAVLVAATGVSVWMAVRATVAEEKSAWRLTEVIAERDAKEAALGDAEAVSAFLSEVLGSPDPAKAGHKITVVESLARARSKLDHYFRGQPMRKSMLEWVLGNTYWSLGQFQDSIELWESVRDYCVQNHGPDHTRTLSVQSNLVLVYFDAGRRREARALGEKLLEAFKRIGGAKDPETVKMLSRLSIVYEGAGLHEEARKLREQALSGIELVADLPEEEVFVAKDNMASSFSNAGNHKEAIKIEESLLEEMKGVYPPDHPRILAATSNLGIFCYLNGDYRRALEIRTAALALHRRVFTAEHTETLKAMHNLAVSLDQDGQTEAAMEMKKEVLERRERILPAGHEDIIKARLNLANAHSVAGEPEEALRLFKLAYQAGESNLEPGSETTLTALDGIASMTEKLGDIKGAIVKREECLALCEKHIPERRFTLAAMTNLASSYLNDGDAERALPLQKRALELKLVRLPQGHQWTLNAMNNLAECYRLLERHDEEEKMRKEMEELKALSGR